MGKGDVHVNSEFRKLKSTLDGANSKTNRGAHAAPLLIFNEAFDYQNEVVSVRRYARGDPGVMLVLLLANTS